MISPPGDTIRDLFQFPDAWAQARTSTGAILYADHNLTHFTDAELKTWFGIMRTWNITLELEVGAIKGWGATATATFQAEQPLWDRALGLGANLTSIVMDEPFAASRDLHKPDTYAVEQTAAFIAMVRHRYPAMLIGDVEPYPGIPLADHTAWLNQLQARLHELNVAPLDFYRLDVDWVSFAKAGRGNWQDVAALAAATHKAGVPFSMIYWASGYPSEVQDGTAGDDTYYIEVLGQGYAMSNTGTHPDQFVLESWINAPSQIVPDSAEYTFTRTVKDFARKFLAPAGSTQPSPRQ